MATRARVAGEARMTDEEAPYRVSGGARLDTAGPAVDESDAAERDLEERELDDERELTDDDRFAMFQDSVMDSVLPALPSMPGFHVCWLTTTNPRDTIIQRQRLGYKLIYARDVTGWQGIAMKDGAHAGVISVNEMVAAKLPIGLYNRYMREVHHTRPLSEEEKIRISVDQLREDAMAAGGRLQEGDGMSRVVQRAPAPQSFPE